MNTPYPRTQPNIIATGMTIAPASMESAVCAQVDPELFFPQKGGLTSEAKRICAGCTVAAQCLEYALNLGYGDTGIWGGTTTAERREIIGRKQAPRHLTDAESREVADLVAAGLSYAEIGRRMGFSRQTIRQHALHRVAS